MSDEHYTQAQAEYLRLQTARAKPRPFDRTLPAPRLVEFRCDKQGHLLGVIYRSQQGPLFASTADDFASDPDTRRIVVENGRRLAEQFPDAARMMKHLPLLPSPRLPLVDETFSDDPCPINCRCGPWPALTRTVLLWAIEQPSRGEKPFVVRVSLDGLRPSGDTL